MILIISDNRSRSNRIVDVVGRRFRWEVVEISDLAKRSGAGVTLFMVDVDLAAASIADGLKEAANGLLRSAPSIFLTNSPARAVVMQANALGATAILAPPFRPARLDACVDRLIPGAGGAPWTDRPDTEKLALQGVALLTDSIEMSLQAGVPLPAEQVLACSEMVATSLRECGLGSWLEAVRQHHSHTHRHCLSVSGLAAAFGLELGMSMADVRRLTTCALLHDVGKARIPLSTLDKPGLLTPVEREEMDRHPIYGSEIILANPSFDSDVVDVVRHHHEYLDGSGYPDGLATDSISDLVRVTTILDLYCTLIDARAHMEPMTGDAAYRVLEGMDGKLDMDVLRAFRPLAFRDGSTFGDSIVKGVAGA